jgi:hypothetical protein
MGRSQAAASCCGQKVMVVSVAVTSGQEVQAGKVGRGERKRTVDEVSKSD